MSQARLSQSAALALGILLSSGSGCAQEPAAQDRWGALAPASVQIHNSVERCLKLSAKEIVVHGEIVKLIAEAESLQSTAECGCRSALLSYRSYEQQTPDYADTWVTALVSAGTLQPGARKRLEFVLTSDKSINFRQAVSIEFGCAPDE